MANTPDHPVEGDSRHRLALGIAVSLIAHVALFVTMVVASPLSRASRPLAEHPQNEEEQQPDREVPLGDFDSKVTSMSWIGYDEYQQQFSTEPSTVDQPQLTRTPRAPVMAHADAAQTTEAQPIPREPVQAQSLADASEPREAQPEPDQALDETLALVEGPPIELAGDIAIDELLGEGLPEPNEEDSPSPEATLSEAEPSQPQPEQQAQAAAPSPEDPGEPSDKDVPFAARFEAKESELGKNIVSTGLTIKPRKTTPTMYSHVTRALRSPWNPVFRIHFRANGSVDRVEVVETSKVPQVDSALMNLLYNWRAEGPQLESLREGTEDQRGETLPIEIRILLRQ